jgi:hypothetical protein
MTKKIMTFIIGIYLSISLTITGYNYINPKITYDTIKVTRIDSYGNPLETRHFYDISRPKSELNTKQSTVIKENISYEKFKYSLLFSGIGLILLYSFLQLFINKNNK